MVMGGDEIRRFASRAICSPTSMPSRPITVERDGHHNVRRSARTPYAMSVAVPTPAA